MSKKEELYQQLKEINSQMENLEEVREQIYFRIDQMEANEHGYLCIQGGR